jgi:hypothetical protein
MSNLDKLIEEIFTQPTTGCVESRPKARTKKMGFDGIIVDGIIACC